jgi:hypothetical protein
MAKVNLIERKEKLSLNKIVKYQLDVHCFLKNILLSNSELDCLSLLSITSETDLLKFCMETVENNIYKSKQSARNFLVKAEKLNLVLRNRVEKTISIHPDLKINTQGNILLNYKFIYIVTEKE